MFELEKDERIRGIDRTSTALAMAFAHDFILETMLTNEMLSYEPEKAASLSRILVERWQRRYGAPLTGGPEPSPEFVRQLYATKAFVDRLARKALRRSMDARETAPRNTGGPANEVTKEMTQAGATALARSAHLPAEELADEVYRAMTSLRRLTNDQKS